jgi:hypothetical protein
VTRAWRVTPTLTRKRAAEPKPDGRQTRIDKVRADHYARLALITSGFNRAVTELTANAQEARRSENARYRTALEEAKRR